MVPRAEAVKNRFFNTLDNGATLKSNIGFGAPLMACDSLSGTSTMVLGEEEDAVNKDGKDAAAVSLGKRGEPDSEAAKNDCRKGRRGAHFARK